MKLFNDDHFGFCQVVGGFSICKVSSDIIHFFLLNLAFTIPTFTSIEESSRGNPFFLSFSLSVNISVGKG